MVLYKRYEMQSHIRSMLFGHLRVLYSVYSSYPFWLQAYSTTLGFTVTFCLLELGRMTLEKHMNHREQTRRMNDRMKTRKNRIETIRSRMQAETIRSLNAKNVDLQTHIATLQAEIRKKDIRMVMLQMKKRGLKQKIRKYEDREALMEAFGLLQSKKNA